MLLTPEQLQKIVKIVEKHHNAFIVSAIGPEAVPPEILQELEKQGLIEDHLNSIEQAYLYGQVLGILQNTAAAKMGFADFQKYVRKNPIPLSVPEQRAVKFAQLQAAGYIKGLGNKVSQATGQLMINADQALEAKLQKIVQDKTAENIAQRETVKQLKTDLGWASKDWTRDWDRIAVTEKQNSMQMGMADHLFKRHGDKVLVAKRTMPDACKHCSRLYDGPDGNPRIFPLSVLLANGANVGKKTAEWQAVIGTVHPHCQCQLIHVPAGYGFSKTGEMVPGGKGGKVYKSEAELCRAILREDDLRKALSGGEQLVHLWGLPIHIENPKGTSRTFHTPDGGTDKTWMLHAYGEILGTTGADDDPLDVFIGPDPDSEMVYVIEQQNPETGIWDEQKCMLGFSNQEDAERAYGLGYDRPEKFFLQTNPMEVEAFKRWVGLTRVQSAEESPKIRLVIPLPGFGKSGQVSADIGAANSPAGDRSPSPGTSANYCVETPKRFIPEKGKTPGIDPTDLIHDWTEEEEVAAGLKRDKKIYDVSEPLRNVYPIHLPDHAVTGQASAREGTEERRRYVIGNTAKVALRPKNKAEMDLGKSFSMQGVIASGPRGGKIIGWDGPDPIYYREGKETSTHGWMHRLVQHMGGKVAVHQIDSVNKITLKVHPDHKGALEQIRSHFQVPEEIKEGGKYIILSVPKATFEKMENADPYAVFPPKVAEPTPAKPPVKTKYPADPTKFGKVVQKKTERQGTVEVVSRNTVKNPPVTKGFLCKGARVVLHIDKLDGAEATFTGNDQYGNPIFKLKNPTGDVKEVFLKNFKQVEALDKGPDNYKPSTAQVPDNGFVKPTERQQKLLDELIEKTKVVGKHVAKEYSDWLWKNGRESYVVGGAIRDLIAFTAPGTDYQDDQILPQLKDVDYVTTAGGSIVKQCLKEVAADMGPLANNSGSDDWMTQSALYTGPGIDMTGMVSKTTSDGEPWQHPFHAKGDKKVPDIRVDHEMLKDAARRDFTCNCLYYDPQSKVIIDSTGLGIADAQAHVLRLGVPIAQMPKTNSISLRYYKFRIRGWDGDADTHAQCREHFDKEFGPLTAEQRADNLYRTICKKGGTPEKNLEKLRALMQADGDGELFEKHIQGDWGEIVKRLYSNADYFAAKEAKAKTTADKLKKELGKEEY